MRLSLILKSLVFSLSSAVFSASLYALILKLATRTPDILISALIAVGVFIAVFVTLMLVIRPTDKRLARLFDAKLSLGEKVQTMVEFDGECGGMIEVQRADTDRIIKSAPKRKLASERPYLHLIAPLLALVILPIAIFAGVRTPDVPPAPPPTEDTSDLWELSDWHKTSLRLLIEEVNASKLVPEGKTKITATLEELILELAPIKSKTQMKKTVIDAMLEIDAAVDGINTFSQVNKALGNSASERVKEFAVALGTPSEPITESKFALLEVNMSKENAVAELEEFESAIKLFYAAANDKEKTDKLYVSIYNFAIEAGKLADVLSAPDFSGDKDALFSKLFATGGEEISAALQEQKYNRDMSDTAINRLMQIFGIEYSEIPDSLKYNEDGEAGGVTGGDTPDKDNDHIVTGGGKGDGENIYASDDMIFDKDKGEHVKYGEVIDSYDVKKTDVINNSSLPDSIKDAISKYFGDLYYNKDKE